ncbi:MAG: AAA family ATPase [Chlorobi bacterium]|nr:AAA family ATPase [Chlorobiota bacterium]
MIFGKKSNGDKYKLNSLKVYAWDRTVGDKKKFRRVFEKAELSYLSVELSIYNKLFDEEDWGCELKFLLNKIEEDESLTKITEKVDEVRISKTENICEYNFGWGSDEHGSFWDPGVYEWEAFIDGEYIISAKFYVQDVGIVSSSENPYLNVGSLRTYEAPKGDLEESERVYLKTFDSETCRYIMGELKFLSKLDHEWYCELFFNFYDDTGMLIGGSDSFFLVTPKNGVNEEFTVTLGWGFDKPGLWIKDNYTLEISFMDTLVAVLPFSIDNEEVRRISDYEALLNEEVASVFDNSIIADRVKDKENGDVVSKDEEQESTNKAGEEGQGEKSEEKIELYIDDRPVEEILAELDSLIGLGNIKQKVREYIDYVSFIQLREESGIKEEDEVVLHSVLTGNPGTGKTTVVKLLGKIFKSMGLLSKGHVHIVEASDLVSGFIRQTGKDTKKAIEKARGGILFIDEAYMLYKEGSSGDFGPEAIAALITEMSDGKGDIAIFMAGYPEEMQSLISSNPGLKSRLKNFFEFKDYTPDELYDISEFAAKKRALVISRPAAKKLKKILTDAFRKRDRSFGNARYVFSLIDEAKVNLGIRIINDTGQDEFTKTQLSTLKDIDIEDINENEFDTSPNIALDEALLKEAVAELESLSGLEEVKKEVRDLIKLSKYYRDIGRDVLKAFSMHSIFTGNPGTGKTTVARIMAKVYKALGVLERGHLVDVDGSALIAGYLGQSALKTKELVEKAMGGILFIDEAYSITDGNNSDFGKKAIAALIKEMEDKRGQFGVIVAGYTKNMSDFVESNPGIKSRFDQTFHFSDFDEDELWEIMLNMFAGSNLTPGKEAAGHLRKYISFLYANRDKFFGNARSMRKIVEKAVRNQELRMSDLPKAERKPNVLNVIDIVDVIDFVPQKDEMLKRQPLGFKI